MAVSLWDYKDKVNFEPEEANGIILARTGHSRTTLWCLLPGQRIGTHVHSGDHTWVVLEGQGNFIGEGEPQPLFPGQVLVIPAGTTHGVENSSSKGLVLISVSVG